MPDLEQKPRTRGRKPVAEEAPPAPPSDGDDEPTAPSETGARPGTGVGAEEPGADEGKKPARRRTRKMSESPEARAEDDTSASA